MAAAAGATDLTRNDLARTANWSGQLLAETGKAQEAEGSTARHSRSCKGWPTTTPPSPSFAATCQKATTTSLFCCGRRATQPRRSRACPARCSDWEKLADDNPAVALFQSMLAGSHNDLARLLASTGNVSQAGAEYHTALAIQSKLAEDHPADSRFQNDLAITHNNLGNLLSEADKAR